MRTRHRIVIFALVLMATMLLSQMAVWADPPSLPAVFYGRLDLASYTPNSRIVAYVSGVQVGSTVIREDGTYGLVYVLDVPADDPNTPGLDGGQLGDKVTFALQMPWGTIYSLMQTATWQGGGSWQVDLADRSRIRLPLIITG
jgi:hypothetical protein